MKRRYLLPELNSWRLQYNDFIYVSTFTSPLWCHWRIRVNES